MINKLFQKCCSVLCNFSLLLNIFLPFFSAVPAYATDNSLVSAFTYNDSSHKINILKNSSGDIPYQLFYKSDSKIDSIVGSNLPSSFYLGTCSNGDCISQNFDSAILKIKTDSSFYYYYLTLKNNQLIKVDEGDSSQLDLTDKENSLLENGITVPSLWTFEKVELNKEYVAPQNNGVKLTFTKLPESSGNIKIEEITLTSEQIDQTSSLSDKAYDITSDMADGSFAYNLSLPIPDSSTRKTVDIKYAEDISKIGSAEKINNTITNTNTSVSVNNLDHFTVFIVTNPLPLGISVGDSCTVASINGNCYDTIQGAINIANIGDTVSLASNINTNSQININKAIIFEGNGYTIYPQFSKTNNSNNSTITIYSNGVKINNLKIDGTNGTNLHGINLYTVNNVYFDSVTVSNNDHSGITVNGSTLTVNNLNTSGNSWGGVNIDQGGGVSTPGSLTVGGTSHHTEPIAIWMDDYHKAVSLIDTNHQYQYVDNGNMRIFTLVTTPACNGSSFDTFELGSVNSQDGWSSTGPYDQAIVSNSYEFDSFGCKTLRLSNGIASGSFGDQTFSYSNTNEAGETLATSGGQSSGTRQNHFEAQFDFASAQRSQQPDLSISVSPDRGDGSRMSYLRFVDDTDGIDVFFDDVSGITSPVNFDETKIADNLSRTTTHSAKFVIDFVDGSSNDVVKIYIDGTLAKTGTTWENYYRFDNEASAEQGPRTTDNLLFRAGGTSVPANNGKGFIFDNISLSSSTISSDTTPPAVPSLISPIDGVYRHTSNSNFSDWSDVTDPSGVIYRYQSASDSGFTNLYYDSNNYGPLTESKIMNPGEPEVSYYWRVQACDTVGNCSAWTSPWKINIDNTVPSIPNNLSYSTTNGKVLGCGNITNQYNVVAKWNASIDTNFSNYEYKSFNPTNGWVWNGGNIGNTLSRSGAFTVGEGTYGFAVRAVDKAGNVSNWTSENLTNSCQIIYDNTAPSIPTATLIANGINVPTNGYTNSKTFKFSLSSANATRYQLKYWNDIIGSSYKINNPWNPTTLNAAYSDNFTQGEGKHFFAFSACDVAGNCSAYSTPFTVTYDKTSPIVNIISPKGGDILKGVVNISGSVTDDNPHHYYFVVKKINGSVVAGPGTVYQNNVSNWNWDTTKVPDGTYIIDLEARDAANNKDTNSVKTITVIVDNAVPASTIDGGINNGIIYSNTWNGSITGTASDNLSGVDKVLLSVERTSDGKYYSPDDGWINGTEETTRITTNGTTMWNFTLPEPLEDIYIIKSHAIDKAGNTENTYTLTIVLDKTIPEVIISLNPATPDASNNWYKTQPEVTLTATDANFYKIEYQWDSQTGVWTDYNGSPFKLTNEGGHVLYYRAIDKANNLSGVGIKNIAWDQTDLEYGPQNISANPSPTSGSTSKIKWELAKDNTGIDKYEIQWSLNGKNYSKTVSAGTTEVEIDNLTEGNWNVKVVAFDQSGRSKEGSINLQVDRTGPDAPTLTLTATSAGTATLSWNAISDATDYIIWYGNAPGSRLYGARVGKVTSYTVSSLGAGNYYFIVKAVDAAQNQGAESNEVNTGVIIGTVGIVPGTPAQGFTPQVLGATETTPSSPTGVPNGEVLGVSAKNLSYLWWLLLLIPLYFGTRRIFKKKSSQ